MIDSSGVDNPPRSIDFSPHSNNHTPLPDMDRAGERTHSTPLDSEKLNHLQKKDSKEDEFMMQALRDSLEDKKNIEPKKTDVINIPKNNLVVQQGFFMPFINRFNNTIEGIWNALKSLIPIKPQTGA